MHVSASISNYVRAIIPLIYDARWRTRRRRSERAPAGAATTRIPWEFRIAALRDASACCAPFTRNRAPFTENETFEDSHRSRDRSPLRMRDSLELAGLPKDE